MSIVAYKITGPVSLFLYILCYKIEQVRVPNSNGRVYERRRIWYIGYMSDTSSEIELQSVPPKWLHDASSIGIPGRSDYKHRAYMRN